MIFPERPTCSSAGRRGGSLKVGLTESITPNSKTFTEWIIKLRPGVTFHSGKPLTADDVV